MSDFMTTWDMTSADNSSSNSVNNNIGSYVDNSAAWNTAGTIDNANLLNQLTTRSDILANQSMANSINSLNANLATGPNPSSVDSSQLIADLYPNTQTDLQKSVSDIILKTAYSQAELQRQLGNSGGVSSSVTDPGGVYGGENTQDGISLQDQTDQILNNPNSNLSGDSFTQDQINSGLTNQILNSPNSNLSGDSFINYPNLPGTAGSTDFISSLAPSIFYDYTTPFTPGFSQSQQTLSASLPQFTEQLPYASSLPGSGIDQTSSGIMSLRNADNSSYLASAERGQPSAYDLSILPSDNQTLARNLLGSDIYNPNEIAVQQAVANCRGAGQ